MSRHVFLSLAFLIGCTDQVELSVDLDGSLAGASRVEITVLEGACGTLTLADALAPAPPERLVAVESAERDVQPSPIALEDGAYCVIALARADDCSPVAFGFEDVPAEGRSDREITITLSNPGTSSEFCPGELVCDGAGRCVSSDPMDAGMDAGRTDAGRSTDASCTPLGRTCRDGALCEQTCRTHFQCAYEFGAAFEGNNSCRFTGAAAVPALIDAGLVSAPLSIENSLVFPCLWRCICSGGNVDVCLPCCSMRVDPFDCRSPITTAVGCVARLCVDVCTGPGAALCAECVKGEHETLSASLPDAGGRLRDCVQTFEDMTGVEWTMSEASFGFISCP